MRNIETSFDVQNNSSNLLYPIQLIDGVNIEKFCSSSSKYSYILSSGEDMFQVSTELYSMIKAIKQNQTIDGIMQSFEKETSIKFSEDEALLYISKNLVDKGLVKTKDEVIRKKSSSYLYFKTKLLPTWVVSVISSRLKFLFTKEVFPIAFSLSLIFSIILFIFIDKDEIFSSLLYSPSISLKISLISILMLFIHEFGHTSACSSFGAKHKEIGFGVYIRFPVLYSDLTDIWRLPSKNRAIVDIGGIYFQLLLNIIFFVLYKVFDDSIFLYAAYISIIHILFFINPLFRFDGYWLLSDIMGIPNLRKRSADLINLFFQKYILKTKDYLSLSSLETPIKSIIFLYSYTIVSNLFFVYFIVISTNFVINKIPILLPELINEIINLFQKANYNTSIFKSLYLIFTRLIVLFLFSFMTYKIIKMFYSIIKYIQNSFIKKYKTKHSNLINKV